jgi:hypothetical protein
MKYSDGIELNCGCPQRWAIQVDLNNLIRFKFNFNKKFILY